MPGATPADAVREFIAPLQAVLGCVARGKISHTGGGNPKPGQQQQWSLNDGGGVRLRRRADFPIPGQLELHASMYWQVIKDEREGYGPYGILSELAPVTSKSHLRTARMTFEMAIRWAITWGAVPLHDDWENRLALAETPHLLYRSWSTDPEIQGARST
ncbi:MAG: hypothetical protein ACT4NY_32595 [Pseudonocardiales bacterium]